MSPISTELVSPLWSPQPHGAILPANNNSIKSGSSSSSSMLSSYKIAYHKIWPSSSAWTSSWRRKANRKKARSSGRHKRPVFCWVRCATCRRWGARIKRTKNAKKIREKKNHFIIIVLHRQRHKKTAKKAKLSNQKNKNCNKNKKEKCQKLTH